MFISLHGFLLWVLLISSSILFHRQPVFAQSVIHATHSLIFSVMFTILTDSILDTYKNEKAPISKQTLYIEQLECVVLKPSSPAGGRIWRGSPSRHNFTALHFRSPFQLVLHYGALTVSPPTPTSCRPFTPVSPSSFTTVQARVFIRPSV